MVIKSYLRTFGNNNVLATFLCNKRRDFSQGNKSVPVKGEKSIHLNNTYPILLNPNWSNIIYEAQKVVGYLPLVQQMHSDENVDSLNLFLMKEITESKELHKLIDNVIRNNYGKIEMWGLIVLLFSKAANRLTAKTGDTEKSAGIWRSQQELATITQLILISNLMHDNVKNIKKDIHSKCDNATIVRNKIAILTGDYFLSQVFAKAALLKNADIVEEVSNTIKGMPEVEFIIRRNDRHDPIPPLPPKNCKDYAIREWTQIHTLSTANAVGTGCRCVLIVAESDHESQKQAYHFGKHFALALQARIDLTPFTRNNQTNSFDLLSAPVLFHVERDPSILTEIDKCRNPNDNINYSKIFETVQSGPAIQLTKRLQKEQALQAMTLLSAFSENEATRALSNIITALEDC